MYASEVVAARIKELRKGRGWTAQQLANRCEEVGAAQVSPAVIANIETGRLRDGQRTRMLTVEELLLFALALDVPPLALLLPDAALEVTSDVVLGDPLHAAMWISGSLPAKGLPSGGFSKAASELRGYFAADEAIRAAKSADSVARQAQGSAQEQSATQQRDIALERLGMRVEPILRRGILPAALPLPWIGEMVNRGWLAADAVPAEEVADAERRLNEWEEDG